MTDVNRPDEALIEAIARAIHQEFVYGADPTHYDDEDEGLARAAYAAMVEHLGLVEEIGQTPDGFHGNTNMPQAGTACTRYVTPWREVTS